MPTKKYAFIDVLKEYNKKYGRKFKFHPGIGDATIMYSFRDDVFEVAYVNSDDGLIPLFHKTSLSEFIHYNISPTISLSSIRGFILAREESSLNLKIEVLPPSGIRYAYLHRNYYAPSSGQLGKSCMRSKENQKALNFYIKNGVRIVVSIDDNHKIHARALLWSNVKSTRRKTPFTYLDRVYAKSEHIPPLFYKLAEKSGWKYYSSTSAGAAENCYYKDTINITGICHFPYTDTFRHLYYKDGIITSASACMPDDLKYRDTYVILNHTSGGGYIASLDPNRVREALSNDYVSKKDAVFVKRYNGYVLKKNIANVNGTYYSVLDKAVVRTKADGYIIKENSTTEIFTNDMIDKVRAIQSARYDGYIHKSNVVYIRGGVYHKLDNDITCFNGKWYHISECFVNYNRKEMNEELVKQLPFSYTYLPENWVPYWKIAKASVSAERNLIPKECAIIAYNLVYNSIVDDIEYQEVYLTDRRGVIQLVTGELVINSPENKQHLKKFNNKWYIKQEFEEVVKVSPTEGMYIARQPRSSSTSAAFKIPGKKQLTLF